jgi:outer membrane protein insertion porin family
MRAVCLLLLCLSITFSKVIIESNFPLRNNNFTEFETEENLSLILWALQSLKEVKDIRLSIRGKNTVVYVERYPIVKKISVKGNWFIGDEEIKNLLGVRENEPLIEFDRANAEMTLIRYYREKGFLDAEARITIKTDSEGFSTIGVRIREGDLYFTGYPIFKGLRSLPKEKVRIAAGLRPGVVFSEGNARNAQKKISELLNRQGFYENLVYYEGSRRRELKTAFWRVLFPERTPGFKGFLSSLLHGLTNLITHPIATLKAITGKGKVAVPRYTVIEGKRFLVLFRGNRFFTERELRERIFSGGVGVDFFFLEQAKARIEEMYRRKGFFDVKVSYKYQSGEITFTVREGKRYILRVEGDLREGFPFYYDRDEIESVLRREREKLKKEGFLLATITTSRDIDTGSGKVTLSVHPKKGKRILIGDIVYLGVDKEIKKIFNKVRAELPAVLEDELLERVGRELEKYFRREGYLEGTYSVEVKVKEKPRATEFIYFYTVRKGPRYRYGKLMIYGNEKTKAKEIDYTTVKQEFYSSVAEEETMWNLIQSEIFSGARIETFIDRDKKLVHRLLEVREDKRGSFEIGFGYNTEEKFKIDAGIKFKNLMGLGIITRVFGSASEKYRIYELGISDNFFFTWKHFIDLSLFRRFEFHQSFDLDVSGFSSTLGYRPFRWITVSAFYSLTDNQVKGFGYGRFSLTRYGLFFVREKRDDMLNPRNMSHFSLRITKAEGDANYLKYEFNSFLLREILTRFSVNIRIAGGLVGNEAPIFDRFFLGGLRNLRGYNFESISSLFSLTKKRPYLVKENLP